MVNVCGHLQKVSCRLQKSDLLFLFVVMSDAGSLVLVAVSGQDVRNGRHYKTINRWREQLGGNKLVISEKMR